MKPRMWTICAILIGALCANANAQTNTLEKMPLIWPGSAWNSSGNVSPAEKGNILSTTYVEQGYTLFRSRTISFVPYVSLSVSFDTEGYDWNNRVNGQAGVKLVKSFKSGVVSLGAAYVEEYRFKSGSRNSGPVFYASEWFGWNQPTANLTSRKIRFPGSTWLSVGNISPVEKGNVILSAYLEQGMTIAKIRRTSVIPFGAYTLSRDTDGYDWNNRDLYAAGLKLAIPGSSKVTELGVAYQREHRIKSGLDADGIAVFLRFWIGWNPRAGS